MFRFVFLFLGFGLSSALFAQALLPFADSIRMARAIPAVSYAVFKADTILEMGTCGMLSSQSTTKANTNNRFHLGPNTKSVASFIALQLVKEQKIKWNTTISEVFKNVVRSINRAHDTVTLLQLLTHRSLLPRNLDNKQTKYWLKCSDDETPCRLNFCEVILAMDPETKPQSQLYLYSNTGYIVAAAMMEKVTGLSWTKLIEQYVNQKIGTSFKNGWPIEIKPDEPEGHIKKGMKLIPISTIDYHIGKIYAPAGGMNGSIQDESRFMQELLKGLAGQSNVITKEETEFLLYGTPAYALGWDWTVRRGLTSVSHEGSSGAFYCYSIIVKEYGIGIVVMMNAAEENMLDATWLIRDKLLKSYKRKTQ